MGLCVELPDREGLMVVVEGGLELGVRVYRGLGVCVGGGVPVGEGGGVDVREGLWLDVSDR